MTAIAADRRPEEEKLRLDTMNGHPDLMPSSKAHSRAWEDWGTVNPLYAVLTDPKYRHGGDVDEFLRGGKGAVNEILGPAGRCVAASTLGGVGARSSHSWSWTSGR